MGLTEKQLEAVRRALARVDAGTRMALEGQPVELQYATLRAYFAAERRDAAAARAKGMTVEQFRRERERERRAVWARMKKRMAEARAEKDAEAKEQKEAKRR